MVILISGGCKNGKTSIAEKIINNMSSGKNMYYIATMIPYDSEDKKRIEHHIEERSGYNFKTIEIEDNIDPILKEIERFYATDNTPNTNADNSANIRPAFLFDSITAYLLNHIIDRKGEFDDDNLKDNKKENIDFNSLDIANKVIGDFQKLINIASDNNNLATKKALNKLNDNIEEKNINILKSKIDIIFVSDYIYSDAKMYTDFVKYYTSSLGEVDRYVAKNADAVLEVSNGNIIYHKGKENVEKYL